jgi:hypothetical protein
LVPYLAPNGRRNYISLNIAAAILYRGFAREDEGRPQTEEDLERRLDDAARTLSIAIRIYRLDLPDPLAIGNTTIAEGIFAEGARILRFADGRPPIDSLGVHREDLDKAFSRLAHIVPQSRPETIVPSRFQRPKL